jgi:hypothetical protein
MTVLRSILELNCTLRATTGLLFSHDSPTSYRQRKFRRHDPGPAGAAIVEGSALALPI